MPYIEWGFSPGRLPSGVMTITINYFYLIITHFATFAAIYTLPNKKSLTTFAMRDYYSLQTLIKSAAHISLVFAVVHAAVEFHVVRQIKGCLAKLHGDG